LALGRHARGVQLMDAGRQFLAVDALVGPAADGLPEAAGGGDPACVEALLDAGAKIDARDAAGQTALHRAVRTGSRECVQKLLARDADVNAKTATRQTPLMLARLAGRDDLVELLRSRGAAETPLPARTPPPAP
jgi:ankyrin repeat protein